MSETLDGVEGVDFGELTEADLAMLQHASATGAVDVDFSEFLASQVNISSSSTYLASGTFTGGGS